MSHIYYLLLCDKYYRVISEIDVPLTQVLTNNL